MESQKERIKAYLLSGRSLTPLDALYQFGCFRLGARINDLKREGVPIKSDMIEIISEGKKKRVAKYSIEK